jgi:DNA-binding NarL/FixJ family response regulator
LATTDERVRTSSGGSYLRDVRVVIVDDHVLFAEVLRSYLLREGAAAVDLVASGYEALGVVESCGPDIALVDLGLPDLDGLTLGAMIRERHPDVAVVAVTGVNDARIVRDAVRAGFAGYLTKQTPVGRFGEAIAEILAGRGIFPDHLASVGNGEARPASREAAAVASSLTNREREVLELLADGLDSAAIARALGIEPNTVRTHVQQILTKLQVSSRLEAVTFATRNGLVP